MHESRAAPALGRRAIQFLIALAAVAAFAPAFFLGWGPLVGTAEASTNVTITDVQSDPAAPLAQEPTGVTTDAIAPAAVVDTQDNGIIDYASIPIVGGGLTVIEITLLAIIGVILIIGTFGFASGVTSRTQRRRASVADGDTGEQRLSAIGYVAKIPIVAGVAQLAHRCWTSTIRIPQTE